MKKACAIFSVLIIIFCLNNYCKIENEINIIYGEFPKVELDIVYTTSADDEIRNSLRMLTNGNIIHRHIVKNSHVVIDGILVTHRELAELIKNNNVASIDELRNIYGQIVWINNSFAVFDGWPLDINKFYYFDIKKNKSMIIPKEDNDEILLSAYEFGNSKYLLTDYGIYNVFDEVRKDTYIFNENLQLGEHSIAEINVFDYHISEKYIFYYIDIYNLNEEKDRIISKNTLFNVFLKNDNEWHVFQIKDYKIVNCFIENDTINVLYVEDKENSLLKMVKYNLLNGCLTERVLFCDDFGGQDINLGERSKSFIVDDYLIITSPSVSKQGQYVIFTNKNSLDIVCIAIVNDVYNIVDITAV